MLVCRYLTCMEGRSQCLLSPPPLWIAEHSPERPPWHGRIYCPRRTSGHLSSTEEVPGQIQDRKREWDWNLEECLNNDGRAGLVHIVCITLDLSVSDSKYEWFPYGTRRYLKRKVLYELNLTMTVQNLFCNWGKIKQTTMRTSESAAPFCWLKHAAAAPSAPRLRWSHSTPLGHWGVDPGGSCWWYQTARCAWTRTETNYSDSQSTGIDSFLSQRPILNIC